MQTFNCLLEIKKGCSRRHEVCEKSGHLCQLIPLISKQLYKSSFLEYGHNQNCFYVSLLLALIQRIKEVGAIVQIVPPQGKKNKKQKNLTFCQSSYTSFHTSNTLQILSLKGTKIILSIPWMKNSAIKRKCYEKSQFQRATHLLWFTIFIMLTNHLVLIPGQSYYLKGISYAED